MLSNLSRCAKTEDVRAEARLCMCGGLAGYSIATGPGLLDQSRARPSRTLLRRVANQSLVRQPSDPRTLHRSDIRNPPRESPAICCVRGDKPRQNRGYHPCPRLWPKMPVHHRPILPAPGPSGSRVEGGEGPPPKKRRANAGTACNSCRAKKGSVSQPTSRFPDVALPTPPPATNS